MSRSNQQLAEVGKGIANHYRVQILFAIEKYPGLTLEDLADMTNIHYKTLSVHVARLHRSGLIEKKYYIRNVLHFLTPRGHYVLTFLRKLD